MNQNKTFILFNQNFIMKTFYLLKTVFLNNVDSLLIIDDKLIYTQPTDKKHEDYLSFFWHLENLFLIS